MDLMTNLSATINPQVRKKQCARLAEVKASRDKTAVTSALTAITECARTGEGNLLALSIEAARHRATVGEISNAMEEVTNLFYLLRRFLHCCRRTWVVKMELQFINVFRIECIASFSGSCIMEL